MSTESSLSTIPTAPRVHDPRRLHRWVCIVGGSLAIVGAALGYLVDPAWAGLAALSGLALLFVPDRACCNR